MDYIQIDSKQDYEKPIDTSSKRRNLLLLIIALLLLANLIINSGLFFQNNKYETIDIDCRFVEDLASEGWRVVAAYSFSTGSSYLGFTVYNKCILERQTTIFQIFQ